MVVGPLAGFGTTGVAFPAPLLGPGPGAYEVADPWLPKGLQSPRPHRSPRVILWPVTDETPLPTAPPRSPVPKRRSPRMSVLSTVACSRLPVALPTLSPRSQLLREMPPNHELRQIGDSTFLRCQLPPWNAAVLTPRRQPLQAREALLASERPRREMVAALERAHQREWHAAAELAAQAAARRAEQDREWEERRRNNVSVADLLSPSADAATGQVDTLQECHKRRIHTQQRSPRQKMAPTTAGARSRGVVRKLSAVDQAGPSDVHRFWDKS